MYDQFDYPEIPHCPECYGTGMMFPICPVCDGEGWAEDSDGEWNVCPVCLAEECGACGGTGDEVTDDGKINWPY